MPASTCLGGTYIELGGAAGIMVGILFLLATVLVFVLPTAPTSGGSATLQYIDSNKVGYITEQILYNAPGFLTAVVFLALYPVLKGLNKSYAAIGVVVSIAAWVPPAMAALDLFSGLVNLSGEYAAATTEAQRTAFATAAEALVAQTDIAFAAGVLAAIGILVVSLIMLKGVFGRRIAYLGVATGALGIVSEGLRPFVGFGYVIYGLLLIVWFIVIGWDLYKISANQG